MAQATNTVVFTNTKVWLSTDGVNFTDYSGFYSEVMLKGFKRNTGEFYTGDGDTPVLGRGKRKPGTVTIKFCWTEGASDPYKLFKAAYENATDLYARWSPKGASTNLQFTTAAGIASEPPYPEGKVEKGEIVTFMGELECSKITESTIA